MHRSKYQLMHTVRTHLGARDDAYNCIFQVRRGGGWGCRVGSILGSSSVERVGLGFRV